MLCHDNVSSDFMCFVPGNGRMVACLTGMPKVNGVIKVQGKNRSLEKVPAIGYKIHVIIYRKH